MAYILVDDIINAYGQLQVNKISTPVGTQVSDPAIIQRGIDSASSIIDSYIGGRYSLPLSVVPPILVDIAIDLAVYKMALGTTVRTPEMRVRYDDALAMLLNISKGAISIGLSDDDLATNGDQGVTKQNLGRSIRTFRI